MKNKVIGLVALLICILTLTASTKSFVSDPQGLFDNQTKELVNQKNESYQKTKTKPEIRLLSLKDSKDLNRIQPLKNQIIIAVALQNKRKMFKLLLVRIIKIF
ncbi:hypothetical protein HMPREF9209_1839 [Lactobacillus gasseri 224-1]|uniref:Uncharacterized protein n=1 Tax=Lactobacillus gasseri 224-1 TaxID=679196 RepID=D1YL02_LACGS|nr:hypothetical protein HMPREF9209_1839 [Lactobacillus gasseri 224-1]